MSTVTYGGAIKKYAHSTPSAERVFAFFLGCFHFLKHFENNFSIFYPTFDPRNEAVRDTLQT
jgi:hypothetical protein